MIATLVLTCSCSRDTSQQPPASAYPVALDPEKVGTYPAFTKSGGGYVYDEVLEYRVWVDEEGDDWYKAFATYEEAERFSKHTDRAEEPLVLVLQREHINEPEPGKLVHVVGDRITEWRVEWLAGSKRGPDTIRRLIEMQPEEARKQEHAEEIDKGEKLAELLDRGRFWNVPFDELTSAERVVRAVWVLEAEVNNGGFDQYYFNSSGETAFAVVVALNAIGAERTARIVAEANAVFPGSDPPRDDSERRRLLESLAPERRGLLDKLDEQFYESPDDLTELLYQWVVQNAAKIRGASEVGL